MAKKRICNGCKALRISGGEFRCSLGYGVVQVSKGFDIPVTAKPDEECPKPMTDKSYRELISN